MRMFYKKMLWAIETDDCMIFCTNNFDSGNIEKYTVEFQRKNFWVK